MPPLLELCEPALGRITVEDEHGERVLRLAGEIDAEAIASFFATGSVGTVCGADSESLPIAAVDLAEVTFLSSSALSFLVRQTQASRNDGHLPRLRGATPSARRVMDITGVTGLFQLAA